MKFEIHPIASLIVALGIQVLYTIGVWQVANHTMSIEQQIEIDDLTQRLEDCQWQLLERNAEIETLTKRIELDSLINH